MHQSFTPASAAERIVEASTRPIEYFRLLHYDILFCCWDGRCRLHPTCLLVRLLLDNSFIPVLWDEVSLNPEWQKLVHPNQ